MRGFHFLTSTCRLGFDGESDSEPSDDIHGLGVRASLELGKKPRTSGRDKRILTPDGDVAKDIHPFLLHQFCQHMVRIYSHAAVNRNSESQLTGKPRHVLDKIADNVSWFERHDGSGNSDQIIVGKRKVG